MLTILNLHSVRLGGLIYLTPGTQVCPRRGDGSPTAVGPSIPEERTGGRSYPKEHFPEAPTSGTWSDSGWAFPRVVQFAASSARRFLPVKICEQCACRDECRVPTEGLEVQCRARTTLGNNVRRLRHEAGLTQHQLAEQAGIDRSYLARIECEGLNISINVVFALAKALKIEPYGLFDDDAEIDGAA